MWLCIPSVLVQDARNNSFVKCTSQLRTEGGFSEATLRPSDRASDRESDRPIDRAIERTSDRAIERAIERPSDRATDRPSDRAIERSSDRASERAIDRQFIKRPSNRTTATLVFLAGTIVIP